MLEVIARILVLHRPGDNLCVACMIKHSPRGSA